MDIDDLEVMMLLKLPARFTGRFTYVDCGSRGDITKPLLSLFEQSHYVGFDPELTMPTDNDPSRTYFPVALGKQVGSVEFYRTQNLNCSSVFIPNREFIDRFIEIGDFFNINEIVQLNLVSLDEYLPGNGICQVDFIELDTQGSELDILQGAKDFLSTSVLGIRVEVEFSEMYLGQPLFADVDSFIRQFGFELFDLERYHLKRKVNHTHSSGREQIAWGQALYFLDWKHAPRSISKEELMKLAMISSYFGYNSYVYEIIEYLLNENDYILDANERERLSDIYRTGISNYRLVLQRVLSIILRRLGTPIQFLMDAKNKLGSSGTSSYFWKD